VGWKASKTVANNLRVELVKTARKTSLGIEMFFYLWKNTIMVCITVGWNQQNPGTFPHLFTVLFYLHKD
jgi:hypothetical protein